MPWKVTDAMDQKIELIRYWKNNQMTVTDLSSVFEISRKTAYKWIQRYEKEGPKGLVDRSAAPFRHPNASSDVAVDKVVSVKRLFKRWGPKKIWARLKDEYPGKSSRLQAQ